MDIWKGPDFCFECINKHVVIYEGGIEHLIKDPYLGGEIWTLYTEEDKNGEMIWPNIFSVWTPNDWDNSNRLCVDCKEPIYKGLFVAHIKDGTYQHEPRCSKCFTKRVPVWRCHDASTGCGVNRDCASVIYYNKSQHLLDYRHFGD